MTKSFGVFAHVKGSAVDAAEWTVHSGKDGWAWAQHEASRFHRDGYQTVIIREVGDVIGRVREDGVIVVREGATV